MITQKRICIWSGPRNISTAMMYSFAQRADTTVVDEPFYAHYLTTTDAKTYHPGAEDVLQEMNPIGNEVIEEITTKDYGTPIVFFKMIIHHIVDLDWTFLDKTTNVLLTRNPVDMLPSFAKVVPGLGLNDTGYDVHSKMLTYLQNIGQNPPVLESETVLKNPAVVLEKLCQQIGISFDTAMLSWEPGARPEDGSWAKYWYASVHKSSGFQRYQPKSEPFPETLHWLLDICQPYYDQVAPLAISAE
ncbi:MAG: sulfotransferase family protein [Chloroflexota bacterium]